MDNVFAALGGGSAYGYASNPFGWGGGGGGGASPSAANAPTYLENAPSTPAATTSNAPWYRTALPWIAGGVLGVLAAPAGILSAGGLALAGAGWLGTKALMSDTAATAVASLGASVGKYSENQEQRLQYETVIGIAKATLEAVKNVRESERGAWFVCATMLITARTILTQIENDFADITAPELKRLDLLHNKGYMKVRKNYSRLLDETLRVCRFRIRFAWLTTNGGGLQWSDVPDAAFVRAFATYVLSGATPEEVQALADHGINGALSARPGYRQYLTQLTYDGAFTIPNSNGLTISFLRLGGLVDTKSSPDESKRVERVAQSLKEVYVSLESDANLFARRTIYLNDSGEPVDGMRAFYADPAGSMQAMYTFVAGACADYAFLPRHSTLTLHAPMLFFRRLLLAATIFMTPEECVGSNLLWLALDMTSKLLYDHDLRQVAQRAIKARSALLLLLLAKGRANAAIKAGGADTFVADEKAVWKLLKKMTTLLGSNAEFAGVPRQRQSYSRYFMTAISSPSQPVYLSVKEPLVAFVFSYLGFADSGTWADSRSTYKIPSPCRVASLYLDERWAFTISSRDLRKWQYVGYVLRSRGTPQANLLPEYGAAKLEYSASTEQKYWEAYEEQMRARDEERQQRLEALRQRAVSLADADSQKRALLQQYTERQRLERARVDQAARGAFQQLNLS